MNLFGLSFILYHIIYITHIICITHILIFILLKLIKIFFYNFFFLYIKMVNKIYQKHKERLRKEARER